jgi:putative mRNA 3-end processing factor
MVVFIADGIPVLCYTADLYTDDTLMLQGASLPGRVKHLVLESTYARLNHEPRAVTHRRLLESVIATLERGGKAILPAFGVGRAQEAKMLLGQDPRLGTEFPVYYDGMIALTSDVILGSIRAGANSRYSKEFVERAPQLFGEQGLFQPMRDRQAFINDNKPGVVVTTAGMCHGPAATYIQQLAPNPANLVALLGYQADGTIGRQLLNGDRMVEINGTLVPVQCRVESFSLSTHCDRDSLLRVARQLNPESVLLVHGEAGGMEEMAAGISAMLPDARVHIPTIGETIQLVGHNGPSRRSSR